MITRRSLDPRRFNLSARIFSQILYVLSFEKLLLLPPQCDRSAKHPKKDSTSTAVLRREMPHQFSPSTQDRLQEHFRQYSLGSRCARLGKGETLPNIVRWQILSIHSKVATRLFRNSTQSALDWDSTGTTFSHLLQTSTVIH